MNTSKGLTARLRWRARDAVPLRVSPLQLAVPSVFIRVYPRFLLLLAVTVPIRAMS